MIKNIVFDMGRVLLDYDAVRVCWQYTDSSEDVELMSRELFFAEEWVLLDQFELSSVEKAVKGHLPKALELSRSLREHPELPDQLYSSAGGASGGKGKVGFSAGSLSYSAQTKTVKYGEEITIYAEGDEIVGDYSVTHYYCTGFYLDSGAAIKTFSDTNRLHSYTFTATRNMDISADWRKYDY